MLEFLFSFVVGFIAGRLCDHIFKVRVRKPVYDKLKGIFRD